MAKHGTMWAVSVLAVSAAAFSGCTNPEHPPVYVEPKQGTGGSHSGTSSGGKTSGEGGDDGGSGTGGGAPIGGGSNSTFDPGEVYLFGTFSEGDCWVSAIVHWSTPNNTLSGLDCDTWKAEIDPHGERLLVSTERLDLGKIYEFVYDGSGSVEHPERPVHGNDIAIETVCDRAENFFADPGGGELVYRCMDQCNGDECPYYYESGAEYHVPEGHYLIHRGFEGVDFLRPINRGEEGPVVIADRDGKLLVLDPIAEWTIRAHEEGFWVLVAGKERWNIAFDGTVSLDGVYPDPPSSTTLSGPCAFERSGAIICAGGTPTGSDNPSEMYGQLIRAELGADEAEVVYSEADDPLLKMDTYSLLVTGP